MTGKHKSEKFEKKQPDEEKTVEKTQSVNLREDKTMQIQLDQARQTPAALTVLAGPDDFLGISWSLDRVITTVGRSPSVSDIFISHLSLSRSHFQLLQKGEEVCVMDLKSTNGTFVGDQRLEPHKKIPLKNHAQIRAGNVIFKFFEAGQLETFSSSRALSKAQTDSLTGLANRRALDIRGRELFMRYRSLCLIGFDVDKFKEINDTYGHLAGDSVLRQLSEKLSVLVRGGDMLFRYGGDEFCFFVNTPLSKAKQMAQRICDIVKNHKFSFEGKTLSVTVSVGVAGRSPEDKKWEDIYKRADKIFYQAKQSGKNRVCS